MLSEKINICTSEIMFAGDEKRDIECALGAGLFQLL